MNPRYGFTAVVPATPERWIKMQVPQSGEGDCEARVLREIINKLTRDSPLFRSYQFVGVE
jgi:hypothetical protein